MWPTAIGHDLRRAGVAANASSPSLTREGLYWLRLGVVEHVAKFVGRDIGQVEAAGVELLVDLDDRFAHQAVRFLGAAGEEEVVAAGDAFVAVVGVEGQAQQAGDAAFGDPIR